MLRSLDWLCQAKLISKENHFVKDCASRRHQALPSFVKTDVNRASHISDKKENGVCISIALFYDLSIPK